ncbi:HNH endonuclease signature motif containing protein [Nocardia heshunensis]
MTDIADEMAIARAVVAQLRDVHSQIAALQAEEIALMTALYHLRREQQLDLGVSNLNAGEDTATEIGIALKVSQGTADGLIGLGLDLENRCTATREAFAAGRIDLAQTRAITKSLSNASDELLAELEPSLAAYAEKAEPQRIRRTARRRLLEADPAGQAARRKAAEADRYVSITAHDDGTALLDGVLPAAGGQTLYERLREMASTQCCGKDPRTVAQRRADALVALADGTGRLICQCNSAECPRAVVGEVPVPRKALVQVGVSAETLAGLQDNPALLSGLGAIDPALARQIARHARFEIITDTHPATTSGHPTPSTATAVVAETGSAAPTAATTPTVATTTPSTATPIAAAPIAISATTSITAAPSVATAAGAETGFAAAGTTPRPALTRQAENTDSTSELRYRPGARTARQARAIDGICRAPGCHIPAAASDLDHQDRFDHANPQAGGHTTEDNLGARCRRHHRLKTLADNHTNGWEVRHHPGRVVEWRTPTGESVTTEPEGSQYLFPTTVVPPVTAAGVPDAEPTGSIFDPGVAVNIMTELVQVYTTPAQRRQHARARASRRAGINM